MNAKEQAAFFKEMSQHGLCMFPVPDSMMEMQQKGLYVLLRKVWTPIDPRVHLENTDEMIGFATEELAVNFAKDYLGWEWDEPVEVELVELPKETEPVFYRFQAHMMIDLGFGPQEVPLGQMVTNYENDNWYQRLEEESLGRAEQYLAKEYPEKDLDTIAKDIKVRPATIDD